MKALLFAITILCWSFCSCTEQGDPNKALQNRQTAMEVTDKPFARYWWFASEIKKEDIRANLNWLKKNGFGGVELAWVYPLNAMDASLDSSYTPRQAWLSPEWQEMVDAAMLAADSLGLACDLTLGTLWPFGDSHVSYEEASRQYGKKERQRISRSWEYPEEGYVVDHLLPENYMKYFRRMLDSFPQRDLKLPRACFVDSWEVETKGLWYDGLEDEFQRRYNYDIRPYMDSLYSPGNEDRLYDYMKLVSEKVIAFYENFDRTLDEYNIRSRGQCSGAPCDIISAYAQLDIPEGEAMLYEPEYNSIPASAALLAGKNTVSAETFTCLYGWPRNFIREEQTADLKLVADALFASGVNHIVWHGKAHNPAGRDSVNFYASVHLGDSGKLAGELPAFNSYLERVSGYMKKGKPYTDVAVYLPTEDAWMKGIMPPEKQFIWAWGYYEMRYVYFPGELKGHHPSWINRDFLREAVYKDNTLLVGDAAFKHLYVNSLFLDYEVLERISSLAKMGLPVTLKQRPVEAGTLKHDDWDSMIDELLSLPNVREEFRPTVTALVSGSYIPPCRAREGDDGLYIFFANPGAEGIKFPLGYGQSYSDTIKKTELRVYYDNHSYEVKLEFKPYASLLYRFRNGNADKINIEYSPEIPLVRKLPDKFRAPWLIY